LIENVIAYAIPANAARTATIKYLFFRNPIDAGSMTSSNLISSTWFKFIDSPASVDLMASIVYNIVIFIF